MCFDLFRGQGVPWPDFVEDVRFIETTGAGTCWVLDHYSYPPAPEAQLLDSMDGRQLVSTSHRGNRSVPGICETAEVDPRPTE
jgi:hypothetical protein